MSNPRFFGTAKIAQDTRNVMVLMPFIKTSQNAPVDEMDFDHSLVIDLDTLNNDIGEQLTTMANNYHAGEFKTLMEYLEGKSLRNSDRVIAWLHNNGQIQKIASSDIIMKGTRFTFADVNQHIKEDLLKKQPARDVDDARRQQAKEYQEQLQVNESQAHTPPVDSYVPPQPVEEQPVAQPVDAPLTIDQVKEVHGRLIEEYQNSQDKLSSALEVVNQLKSTLSSDMVEQLSSQLTQLSTSADVKGTLVEALAVHYDHIDSDYINRNLNAADQRAKTKENKESKKSSKG